MFFATNFEFSFFCSLAIIVRNPCLGEADSYESILWLGDRLGLVFPGFLPLWSLGRLLGLHTGFVFGGRGAEVAGFFVVKPFEKVAITQTVDVGGRSVGP
ncbi:MAG: hypothetical protein ACOYOZ_13125, partial [Pirellula sp.]